MTSLALPLDCAVPPNGYAWWYLDGLADDGRHGFTVILFVGGVFSVRYFRARQSDAAVDPLAHCVANVCLYGSRRRRDNAWAISEYPRHAVERRPDALRVGGTHLAWVEGPSPHWQVDFVERTAPWRRRISGRIRVFPSALRREVLTLETAGAHRWYPMAPVGRFEAELDAPALRFAGSAYQDANAGAEPIEAGMRQWTWCRATQGDATSVVYDIERRREPPFRLARRFLPDGSFVPIDAPTEARLPEGAYGVARPTRHDAGSTPRLLRSFEDGPFYARGLVDTRLGGAPAAAVQEWADFERFQKPWVQFLLPFKMRTVR